MPFSTLTHHVLCYEVSSLSGFFFSDLIFFYGDHFTIEGYQKATF